MGSSTTNRETKGIEKLLYGRILQDFSLTQQKKPLQNPSLSRGCGNNVVYMKPRIDDTDAQVDRVKSPRQELNDKPVLRAV